MARLGALLRRPVVAIVLVTALAAAIRFLHLGHPGSFVFDEVYYPKVACIYVGGSDETCTVRSGDERYWREHEWDVGSWVHPPLGKWQIALGIKAFGMDSFGWRSSTAVVGTLTVTMVALIAQLLWGSVIWTYAAGLLLATEHLSVVMSRTALLDGHLTFWVVAALLLLLLDRRWVARRQRLVDAQAGADPPDETDGLTFRRPIYSPFWRPWRFACGIAAGAAIAVKWSGVTALAAVVVLTLIWETSRRHRDGRGWPSSFGRGLARESLGGLIAFLLVPAAIFMITWIPWFHHFGWDMGKWVHTQAETVDFHFGDGIAEFEEDPDSGLQTLSHPYYARPIGWPVIMRPTSFYFEDHGPQMEQILAIGNPAIFWGSLLAIPAAFVLWRRDRDWRAGFIAIPFAIQYAPWLLVGRPTFFFYAVPLVPSMVLAVVLLLRRLSDVTLVVRDPGGEVATNPATGAPAVSTANVYRPFVWIYAIAVVGLFLWFWPILTAGRISDLRYPTIVWFPNWI